MPPGSVPPGSVPPGSVPPGSVPPGSVPPGSVPPGSVPPGSVPPGSVPPGSVPPGSVPPGVCEESIPEAVGSRLPEITSLESTSLPPESVTAGSESPQPPSSNAATRDVSANPFASGWMLLRSMMFPLWVWWSPIGPGFGHGCKAVGSRVPGCEVTVLRIRASGSRTNRDFPRAGPRRDTRRAADRFPLDGGGLAG
ncbi:MAG: hypothetical protein EA398_17690 [Deltaproteobacteria bacterium]|nr:MAG: hypothetical protein EA398_17690 [Deltaproteobacteria bacterium]